MGVERETGIGQPIAFDTDAFTELVLCESLRGAPVTERHLAAHGASCLCLALACAPRSRGHYRPVRGPELHDSEPPERYTGLSAEHDLLTLGDSTLTPLERAQIRFIRASLRPGLLDRGIRLLQGSVGQWWIRTVTESLLHVHGLDRLPSWDKASSVVCVANHRSFFDLYVTMAELVAHGLPHRILFPVRSTFFYDHPLGPVVNGVMSFFAMYPPIFRDRKRAALNLASLDELAALLRRGGFFVGIHPEGTRNRGEDPYALLPAQSGVGRVIRKAGVPVVPVFVNGLVNDFVKQVRGGLTKRGTTIHLVFGRPIDFGSLMHEGENPRTYKRIAERCLQAIDGLGQEEKEIRGERGVRAKE